MQTLSLVFSILSLVFSFFVSMTNGNKNMVKILILMFLCNFSMAMSFLCLGSEGINGTVSNIVGSLACLINFFFTSKGKSVPLWLSIVYAFVFTAINFRFGINAESVFALFPCLCFVMAIIQKSGKMFRV